jgi:hypothetical protein
MNWRNRAKLRLIEYKGGCCQRCGYCKPVPGAYDFHHPDPTQKEFTVGGKSWAFDRLKAEVDKCILLCRRCHAEVHHELTEAARSERMQIKERRLCERPCQYCEEIFRPKQSVNKFCSRRCYRLHSRRTTRPSPEQLSSELSRMTWTAVGRKYGVSDRAVRKWAKQYGILDR